MELVAKPTGGRPPIVRPPRTTFAPGEDGRQDMLVVYREIIEKLARMPLPSDPASLDFFCLRLEDLSRHVQDEMNMERMFASEPATPFKELEDEFDLATIQFEFGDPRQRQYRQILDKIHHTIRLFRA